MQQNVTEKAKNGRGKPSALAEEVNAKTHAEEPGDAPQFDAKKAWENATALHNRVKQLVKETENTQEKLAEHLELIADNIGKGPFQVKNLGAVIIKSRKRKDATVGYFLSVFGERELTVIE